MSVLAELSKNNVFGEITDYLKHLEARIKRLEEGRESEEQGTIKDAVQWSGMAKDFIYKQCAAGKFPHHHTEEGLKYFIKSEVKAWRATRFNS